jgi:aminoglycoside 6'-N-acetyltransferase
MEESRYVRMNVTLRGSRIVLRPVEEDDLPRLLEILREPEVARHWSQPDDDFDRRELLSGDSVDGAERITTFVITMNGETIGWIAASEKLHRDYRQAGIDLFLSTPHQGKGFGSEAIRRLCRFLFEERGHHRISIDPAADNTRAIHAYEKVGFRRVGVMRRYERGADGTFHDGMLLDLLPEDLIDSP